MNYRPRLTVRCSGPGLGNESRPPGFRRSRAVLLLEMVLAIALFVSAGLAILALVGQSTDTLRAVRARQHAVDLARSAMARIESGLARPETLNGPVRPWIEGDTARGEGEREFVDTPPPLGGWELRVESEPSGFPGLVLVSVTARRTETAGAVASSYTLRQLVPDSAGTFESPGRAGSFADDREAASW